MSSEAAKVIIDAEDLASKKIAEAARNVERNIKSIKDVGGKAKASTEFIGTLATSLGGSEIGSYAGQLGQLTERISQFSEVSKAGGAGALAFKAGLVGVVGVLSFQVGKAIGDAVFGTKRWKLEIEEATEAAKKLSSEVERAAGTRFSSEMKSIDLLGDPEEAKKATQELLAQLDKDIEAKAKSLEAYRKKVQDVELQWTPLTTIGKTIHEQNKLQVQEAEKLKDIFKEQALELRKKLVEDERSLQLKEQEAAAAERLKKEQAEAAAIQAKVDRSDSYLESLSKEIGMLEAARAGKEALFAETAGQNVFGDQAQFEAEQMLKQIEMLKEQAAAQKALDDERERAARKAEDDAKRVEDIKQRELDRLKEQRILLEQGKEAAKAFALEQQGLDKATAERLAKEQAALDKQVAAKADAERIASSAQPAGLRAIESRLLTRGPSEKGIDKIGKNTEQTVNRLDSLIRKMDDRRGVQLEVVGA